MLDVLDQNLLMHLNNLQANQLDDLENVLLPHLTVDPRTQDSPGQNILDLQNMELSNSGSSSVGSSYTPVPEENLELVEEDIVQGDEETRKGENNIEVEEENLTREDKQIARTENNPRHLLEVDEELDNSAQVGRYSPVPTGSPEFRRTSPSTKNFISQGSHHVNLSGTKSRDKLDESSSSGTGFINKKIDLENCTRRLSSSVTSSLYEKDNTGARSASVPLHIQPFLPSLQSRVKSFVSPGLDLDSNRVIGKPDTNSIDSSLSPVRWIPLGGITLSPLKNLLRPDTIGDLIEHQDSEGGPINDEPDVRDEEPDVITRDEGTSQDQVDDDHDLHPREIIMNLDQVCQTGQKMKFSIPGVSREVTLNFSAEALQEMKNAALKSSFDLATGDQNSEISSSKPVCHSDSEDNSPKLLKKPRRMKKNLRQKLKSNLFNRSPGLNSKVREEISCTVCLKSFPNEGQLKKHMKFHVEKNIPCKFCHESFDKVWVYNKHLEEEHQIKENHECPDCSRMFYQRTELLAHIQSFHQSNKVFKCQVEHFL